MAILLSVITALLFGTGDFFGGLSAKRARIVHVVAGAHVVGLVGITIASLLFAESFDGGDFVLGMIGGAFGGLGVALFYRRLGEGPMAVVAPLTAVTSAAVPALWGLSSGETIGALAWFGVILALVAIGLVSASDDGSTAPVTPGLIIESLLAGVGFALFFIVFDAADASSAPWPVVGARLLTGGVFVAVLFVTRQPLLPADRGALPLIALAGIFDTASNAVFLLATDEGDLTIVAVLSSLYPIATIVLARLVLDERMNRPQQLGSAAALVATALIAAG